MATLGVTFYPHGLSYPVVATLGQLAEEQGFDGVFVVEGGVNNDVMAMVQAIAMRTQRITVGTKLRTSTCAILPRWRLAPWPLMNSLVGAWCWVSV